MPWSKPTESAESIPSHRSRRSRRSRRSDERGNAMVEFTWLGILLLVPLVWIMLAVFDVQRGAYSVSAAARAGARAYTLADSDADGLARAHRAIDLAMTDQGLKPSDATVHISCTTNPCHSPGGVVTVRVHSQVALPWMPAILGRAPSFALDSSQSMPVGEFRDLG